MAGQTALGRRRIHMQTMIKLLKAVRIRGLGLCALWRAVTVRALRHKGLGATLVATRTRSVSGGCDRRCTDGKSLHFMATRT